MESFVSVESVSLTDLQLSGHTQVNFETDTHEWPKVALTRYLSIQHSLGEPELLANLFDASGATTLAVS
jgi:hypothetical protein